MSKGAVVIVVYDGVQLLDVAGPIEVFDGARRALGNSYRVRVASVGGRDIMASADVRLGVELDLTELDADLDTVVVAGGWGYADAARDGEGGQSQFSTWSRAYRDRFAGMSAN